MRRPAQASPAGTATAAARTAVQATRVTVLALVLLLLLAAFAPQPVLAAGNAVHSIDLTVDLNDDGSAHITEVWSVTADEDRSTELYKQLYGLDEQTVENFRVTDENGTLFTDAGAWDVDASREEKAGRSGMVTNSDGYELCWGFGTLGSHTYTLEYDITGLVKAYDDADAMVQVFVSGMEPAPATVSAVIRKEGASFSLSNTRLWLAGAEDGTRGDIEAQNGAIVARSTDFSTNSSFEVMLRFEKDLFAPAVQRSGSFDSVQEKALKNVDYDDGSIPVFIIVLMVLVGAVLVFAAVLAIRAGVRYSRKMAAYKAAPYSRSLPWEDSLPATYMRLDELHVLPDEGAVVGAYILHWLRTGQLEIEKSESAFLKKEQLNLKLYAARPDMAYEERQLYDMLMEAAGSDYILQEKEFKKWSERHHERPQAWLEYMKNTGKQEVRRLAAAEVVDTPRLFGLFTTKSTQYNEKGERLTAEMFGFKTFLQDFTIINEREAREVQLWDRYLVYAQLFGIAEVVAKQFNAIYPDYFRQMDNGMGMGGLSYFDIMLINSMAYRYGHAMNSGYHAGLSAASGGGGGMGGGGFSGASGGGGGGGFR